jgi:hypothetical protein
MGMAQITSTCVVEIWTRSGYGDWPDPPPMNAATRDDWSGPGTIGARVRRKGRNYGDASLLPEAAVDADFGVYLGWHPSWGWLVGVWGMSYCAPDGRVGYRVERGELFATLDEMKAVWELDWWRE